MLKTVIDVVVPALAFMLMFAVGLELTAADFRRVIRQSRVVVLATAANSCYGLWPPPT